MGFVPGFADIWQVDCWCDDSKFRSYVFCVLKYVFCDCKSLFWIAAPFLRNPSLFPVNWVIFGKSLVFPIHTRTENLTIVDSIRQYSTSHFTIFIRPSSDGTYYGMVMSVRVSIRVSVRPPIRPSVHPSVRPSDSPSVRSPSAHFPHFSPTCFHILSWNFGHDFVLMYFRSGSSVVTLRQFLKALCLFVNLE